jgi:hypothetical protein
MARLALIAAALACVACRVDTGGLPDLDGGGDGDGGPPDARPPDGDGGPLVPDEVRLWVAGASGLSTLRLPPGSDIWVDDGLGAAVSGTPEFVVVATSADGAEELVGVQTRQGGAVTVRLFARRGGGVTLEWSHTLTFASQGTYRAFDVAYERASGDALVVIADGQSAPRYRARTGGAGGAWSPLADLPINDDAGPGPDVNFGAARWVELESGPASDRVALGYSDDNDTMAALVWEGDAWRADTARTVTFFLDKNALTFRQENRAYDLAWEEMTGDLMVAFGPDADFGFGWQIWDESNDTWSTTVIEYAALPDGNPYAVELASRPASNRIAMALLDMGGTVERLGLATWSGSQWEDQVELDAQIRQFDDAGNGRLPGALGWVGTKAYLVYADEAGGGVGVAEWTDAAGWSGASLAVTGMGLSESMIMLPAGPRLVAVAVDDGGRLWSLARTADAFGLLAPAPLGPTTPVQSGVGIGLAGRP